jgi:hypothetical protein
MDLIKKAMPAQLKTSHACLGKSMPAVQLVAASSKQMAGKHIRLCAVCHGGSNQEMLESMATYGLPPANQSFHLGGGFTLDRFLEWVEEQKLVEEMLALKPYEQQRKVSVILAGATEEEGRPQESPRRIPRPRAALRLRA